MNAQIERHQIQYGQSTIAFELVYSSRKDLAIHVHPDSSIVVDAPVGSDLPEVKRKIIKRAAWILRQQRLFQTYAPKIIPRQYVSGETHRYLGRQYRLKVSESETEAVKLSRGRFFIAVRDKTDTDRVGRLLEDWYRTRARVVFSVRLSAVYPRVQYLGIPYPDLVIRKMRSRWGSCTASGRLLLNLRLMQVPKYLIDYVIVHELCHLKEHNHSKAFYALLDRALPNWRDRRRRLSEYEFS